MINETASAIITVLLALLVGFAYGVWVGAGSVKAVNYELLLTLFNWLLCLFFGFIIAWLYVAIGFTPAFTLLVVLVGGWYIINYGPVFV